LIYLTFSPKIILIFMMFRWNLFYVQIFSFLCILSFSIFLVESAIIQYDQLMIPVNTFEEFYIGMFSKRDAPWGDGNSYVTMNLEIGFYSDSSFVNNNNNSVFEIALFHSEFLSHIGATIDGTYYMCCYTPQYISGQCSTLGRLIYDSGQEFNQMGMFFYWNISRQSLLEQQPQLFKPSIVNITHSGIWLFYGVNCGEEENSSDTFQYGISGSNIFMNPYGQLPGDIVALEPVYFCLASGYTLFGIFWGYLSFRYRKDLMMLQNCIAIVIVLGIIENFVYGTDYAVYNIRGLVSLPFNVIEVILSTTKRTFGFVCLFLVASGYTVVRANLERVPRIFSIVFGILYFLSSGVYQIVYTLSNTPQTEYLNIPEWVDIAFLIPTTILDILFIIMLYFYINKSTKILLENKQEEKLKMFSKLIWILSVVFTMSFLFFLIELGAAWENDFFSWWKGWFIFTAYWSIIYFAVLCCIGFVWRPSANNARYAYASQLTENSSYDSKIELPSMDS